MNKKHLQRATVFASVCLLVFLSACGVLKGAAPTATPTAGAQPTVLSPAETEAPAAAPTAKEASPTASSGGSTGAAGSATKAPAAPAQPGELKGMPASLRKLGNLRAAPGTDAEILAVFDPGTRVGILGVTTKLTWALVSAPGGLQGWVYFGNLELSGDQKDLLRIESTPTP